MDARNLCNFEYFLPHLVNAARNSAEIGANHHYEGFGVGAAALVRAWDYTGEFPRKVYKILSQFNIKEKKEDEKECAEPRMMHLNSHYDVDYYVGIVVCGEPRPDNMINVVRRVLYTCEVCRMDMRPLVSDSGILRPDTKMVFIRRFSNVSERDSLSGFLQRMEPLDRECGYYRNAA